MEYVQLAGKERTFAVDFPSSAFILPAVRSFALACHPETFFLIKDA